MPQMLMPTGYSVTLFKSKVAATQPKVINSRLKYKPALKLAKTAVFVSFISLGPLKCIAGVI